METLGLPLFQRACISARHIGAHAPVLISEVMVRRGRHRGMQKTRKQNGQALVEMASILPLLSIILLGCLDLGRAFHVHMAAADAAHVGLMYAQQVTDPTTSPPKTITVADVINKTVNAAQGSIPIPLANADSYVKVDVEAPNGTVSSSLTTM